LVTFTLLRLPTVTFALVVVVVTDGIYVDLVGYGCGLRLTLRYVRVPGYLRFTTGLHTRFTRGYGYTRYTTRLRLRTVYTVTVGLTLRRSYVTLLLLHVTRLHHVAGWLRCYGRCLVGYGCYGHTLYFGVTLGWWLRLVTFTVVCHVTRLRCGYVADTRLHGWLPRYARLRTLRYGGLHTFGYVVTVHTRLVVTLLFGCYVVTVVVAGWWLRLVTFTLRLDVDVCRLHTLVALRARYRFGRYHLLVCVYAHAYVWLPTDLQLHTFVYTHTRYRLHVRIAIATLTRCRVGYVGSTVWFDVTLPTV